MKCKKCNNDLIEQQTIGLWENSIFICINCEKIKEIEKQNKTIDLRKRKEEKYGNS